MQSLINMNLENDDLASEFMYFNDVQLDENIEVPQVEQEPYEDFYLFCDVNNSNNESSFLNEDISTNDKPCPSVVSEGKTSSGNSDKAYMMVPFVGMTPDMDQFEKLIQLDMSTKGANQMVNDALQISEDLDTQSDQSKQQLIKVKKRKTKDQLKMLEDQFAKTSDWSKEFMNEFADRIKLDPAQVYKWHWDQICKKLGKNPKKKEKAAKKQLKKDNKRRRKIAGAKSAKLQKTSE